MKKLLRILFGTITLGVGIGSTLYWDSWWEDAFNNLGAGNGWIGTTIAAILVAVILATIADGLRLATPVNIDWREVGSRDRLPGNSFLLHVDPQGVTAETFELIITQQCDGWLARKILKRVVDGTLELHLRCDQPEVKLTKQGSARGVQQGDTIILPLRKPSGVGTWSWTEVSFVATGMPSSLDVDFIAELVVAGKKGRLLKRLLIVDSRIKTITVSRRASA